MPNHPKPVTIRGTTYPSIQAAADALGIGRDAVAFAIQRGRLDTVGLNPMGRTHGRRVTMDGVTYNSMMECARETGLSYDQVRRYFAP